MTYTNKYEAAIRVPSLSSKACVLHRPIVIRNSETHQNRLLQPGLVMFNIEIYLSTGIFLNFLCHFRFFFIYCSIFCIYLYDKKTPNIKSVLQFLTPNKSFNIFETRIEIIIIMAIISYYATFSRHKYIPKCKEYSELENKII